MFLDRNGKPIHHDPDNADSAALWGIAREAYNLLAIKSRKDFIDRYCLFIDAIKAWRKLIGDLADQSKLVGISNVDGRRLDSAELHLEDMDASEILSLVWQILDQAAKRGLVVRDESMAENYLFACLREIDNALIGMFLDGRDAVSSTVAAVNALANAQVLSSGSEAFRKVRRQMAYEAAAARHRKDPKQVDKQFVFHCYEEWRANPSRYKSKARFARDMLDKCAHLESQKKIEDWVRLWDRERVEGGTLPAE